MCVCVEAGALWTLLTEKGHQAICREAGRGLWPGVVPG